MERTRALKMGLAGAGVACIMHASSARAASPCATDRPGIGVPIRVYAFAPADFGVPQEACARTGVWLESRAALLVAAGDFYGSLLGGLAVRAMVELQNGMWLSAWMPGLEYRYVANATVDAGTSSLGAGTLGLHAPIATTADYQLVVYTRALLPTETVFVRARRYGFEEGFTALVPLTRKLQLTNSLAFTSLLTATAGRVLPVWSPSFGSDLVYRPSRGFGVAVGAGLRPLESLDPRAQIRVYPTGPFQISLGALFPVAGRDRTDVAFSLTVGADGL